MISYQDLKQRFILNERSLSVIVVSLFSSWLLAFAFQGQVLLAVISGYVMDTYSLVFWTTAAHFVGLFTCGYFIRNKRAAKRTIIISTVFCIIGSVAFFFPYPFLWHPLLAAMSFSAGFFIAGWGFYFKSCSRSNARIKTAADVMIFSNVLMIFLNIMAVNLSRHAGLAISIMMLIGALLLALKLNADTETGNHVPSSSQTGQRNPVRPLMFLYLFVALITINSGLMYQVINPAFAHHEFLVSWYWAVPYVIALFIVRNLPLKTNRAYVLYVAIAMIGFAFTFFMILDHSATSYFIVNTLMLGAFGVCDLFWWSILGEMLELSDNPARIFGIGLSANVFGVFIGGIIGNEINTAHYNVYNPSVIALIIVFIILIILPLLNRQLSMVLKDHAFLEKLYDIAASQQKNGDTNNIKGYDLTGREIEIALLLLKGRTYKMIAGELFLSENTVKTHIKNIYSKLNVNSKTELVKLLMEKEHTVSR